MLQTVAEKRRTSSLCHVDAQLAASGSFPVECEGVFCIFEVGKLDKGALYAVAVTVSQQAHVANLWHTCVNTCQVEVMV